MTGLQQLAIATLARAGTSQQAIRLYELNVMSKEGVGYTCESTFSRTRKMIVKIEIMRVGMAVRLFDGLPSKHGASCQKEGMKALEESTKL